MLIKFLFSYIYIMGKMLSRLICCDKANDCHAAGAPAQPQTEQIVVYRHTEIEVYKTNIRLESDELGTAIKFYRLNKIK